MKENIRELFKSNINALAIWEEDSMDMPGIHSEKADELFKPNIIFLGLNPSKSLETIRNFHSTSAGDKLLKKVIQGCEGNENEPDSKQLDNLIGGFMTDLTDKVESDSSNIDLSDHSFEHIENVLKVLGENHYHLICFGVKTYEATRNWLLNQTSEEKDVLRCRIERTENLDYDITLYKVMHYSYRFDENRVADQLFYINNKLDKYTGTVQS